MELKNPQEPSYYLKRKGDILILYQDTATGIENATTSDVEADISREGQQLLVSGKGVRKLNCTMREETWSDKHLVRM